MPVDTTIHSPDTSIKVAQCLAGAEFGGAENFYTRLVSALAEEPGIEQRAFTRDNAYRVPILREAGVTVDTFRFGSPLNFIDHWRYKKALKAFDPDIVVTYMNRPSGLTPRGNYKLVCRLGHYYNLKYYRHADYWVGISKGICQHLIDGGMPREKVHYIPNFADETVVAPLDRNSFDTAGDGPVLLAAGRLHTNKGFDILVQALKGIPDAVLWLAGDGPERSALEQLAADTGVSSRIRFLGWRNDVAQLMRTADLFICPSRHEGLGSIVMESWFNQCPIIATNSQGPGELIEDGVTGLVTPLDDVAALGSAIKQLIDKPRLAEQMVVQAYEHYQRYFSKSVIRQTYAEFFRQIIADRSRT